MSSVSQPANLTERTLPPEPLPLRIDEQGAIRLAQSRISLDLVVEQYESGGTPEEIAAAFDTLTVADVYAAITYYLRHRDEVQDYLQRRKAEAAALEAKIKAEHGSLSRESLMARRAAQGTTHAP